MVRTAISQAAFDAIAKTLPLGSVGYGGPQPAKLVKVKLLTEAAVR
jgi:hypothetical protein